MNRSVLITGASSGIGEALAREYARRGWQIALAARRQAQLDTLAAELRTLGAPRVHTAALDVRAFETIAPVVEAAALELGGLDLVVANAGVAHLFRAGEGQLEKLRETIDVDLTGACATIDAAVAVMRRARRGGHIVGITSVARYRGLPKLGVYSACKAGLHRYLQATRMECARDGIAVTELAPGYIDTPMNRDTPSRPFVIDAARGARIMAELIERRVSYATVPQWPWRLMGRLMQLLPAGVVKSLT